MTNSTSPSRRTVVKGAAWTAPAVVVASAVPAMAASNDEELCSVSADELNWYNQGADVVSWTSFRGTDESAIAGMKGTYYDIRMGTWQFGIANNPKFRNQNITGYRINWNPGHPIKLRTIDIDEWNNGGQLVEGPSDPEGNREFEGRFTKQPNANPLYIASGLFFDGGIQTTLPRYLACGPDKFPRRFLASIPFSVTFIRGLDPSGVPQPELVCGAIYYWNAVMYSGLTCSNYSSDERTHWVSVGLPEIAPKA
ncbi:MAG: hypothetical protein Q4P71_03485 [Actinomycetaceae bacterium]|nr:hypothetical protein [Actinomycetaceae bacterium]